MVISSSLVANVLRIINLPMAMENLPIAATGLPLVLIDNDIRASHRIFPCISNKQIFSAVTVTELDFVFYTKNIY